MTNLEFRAWDKQYKVMLNVLEIDFQHRSIRCEPIQRSPKTKWENIELMQSTGLKDKNGVKIFEGDIVKFTWEEYYGSQSLILEVKFGYHSTNGYDPESSPAYGWYYENTNDQDETFSVLREEGIEILGNIYENSDLLQKGGG